MLYNRNPSTYSKSEHQILAVAIVSNYEYVNKINICKKPVNRYQKKSVYNINVPVYENLKKNPSSNNYTIPH